MRALAIVSVVAFHANPSFLPGGFIGVDIFFVISGYLITRILLADIQSGVFTYIEFWMRRVRRILPGLLFMLTVVTLVSLYMLLPDDLNQYGQLLSHAVLFAANIFLAHENGYFAPDGLDSPLLHVWSLAVEEQYYLIWPILVAVSLQVLKRSQVIGAVVILFCGSLAYSEWATVHLPKDAFYGLPSRAFELLIGAGLAFVDPRVRARSIAESLGLCGMVLIGTGMVLINEKTPFPGLAALMPCVGAALILIAGGGVSPTRVKRLLSTSPLVGLGRISYSWYLWHWPPLAFTRYYLERPLSGSEIAVALAAGLAIAAFSWRFVEQPFRAAGEFRRFVLPIAICASVVLLGLGTAFQSLKGIPSRLSPDAIAAVNEFRLDKSLGCIEKAQGKGFLKECDFGDRNTAEPTIMLWGDSHAGHYLPAIARIAAAQGVKGIARIHSGCRPFIDPESLAWTTPRGRSCPPANRQTLAKLLEMRTISVVVLAARWSVHEAVAGADEVKTFDQNLEKTITALEQNGKAVVVLGQVPEIPRSLKACFTKQVWFGRPIGDCDGISPAVTSGYEAAIQMAVQAASFKHGRATFFAPLKYFCDSLVCRAIDQQGRPLYRDSDHLSPRGAYYLEPYIGQTIAPLLRRSHAGIPPVETPN